MRTLFEANLTTTLYMEDPLLIGLDVGGTKIEATLVGRSRAVLGHVHLPMYAQNEERVLESIGVAIERVLDQAQVDVLQVRAAALGIPGQVENGVVQLALNLNLTSYPLARVLAERFRIPFVLENDVRLAALGAYEYLSMKQPLKSLVYLSVGTGISAGVVLDGRLLRGSHGMAGEIGHVVIDPNGPLCKCGMQGCLEALASGPSMTAQAEKAILAGETSLLREVAPLDTRAVYQAAEQGDALSLRIVRKASAYLARAIQGIAMAYDVDKIVLGGGVSHEGDGFINPIRAELEHLRIHSELARRMLPDENILLFPVDTNAGLWGAIALAQQLTNSMFQ